VSPSGAFTDRAHRKQDPSFHTRETARHPRALKANHALRKRLGSLGYRPVPVNRFLPLEPMKSGMARRSRRARGLLHA
jgi:hypothetical protein